MKKTVDQTSGIYVYHAGGQLAAQYTKNGAGSYALLKEFVYAQGGLLAVELAQSSTTEYITTDHLGSTRVVTDAAGNVVSRHDYLPFGKEVPLSSGRTGITGYIPPQNERILQRFTGNEVDPETGLGYFYARYYSGREGRFTSPDPLGIFSADLANPQSLNQYAYVLNNPLLYTDPFGLMRPIVDPNGCTWDSETNTITCPYEGPGGGGGLPPGPGECYDVYLDGVYYGNTCDRGPGERGRGPAESGGGPRKPTDNGTQNNPGPERVERLKNCALSYYGIDPLSATGLASGSKWLLIAAGAGGIPKALLPFRTTTLVGGSRFTSLASILSRGSGTAASGANTLRIAGRFATKWAGPIAIASAVIDATAIGICTASN